MRFFALALLAVASTTLVACQEEELACTAIAAYSVNLQLEDDQGAPITDANVQFSVDASALADCDDFGGGSYACGIEQAGAFTIEIDWNGVQETLELEVDADECHVISESESVVLTPL